MSLLNAYNQIIKESNSSEVKGAVPVSKPITGKEVPIAKSGGGIDEVDSPKEDTKNSVGKEHSGEAKEFKAGKSLKLKESQNPFDALYSKILTQENWEEEDDASNAEHSHEPTDFNFSGDVSTGEGELELQDSAEDPMHEVLAALKTAVSALERILNKDEEAEEPEEEEEEEEEEEPEEDESDESGEDEEETDFTEEVDAEVVGHALVDLEKLASNLTNPKQQVVKGAVPVTKGKAATPKGAKVVSEPTPFKGKGENLEKKNNIDTGYVKKGKNWYDQ